MTTERIHKRRLPVSLAIATPMVLVIVYVISIGPVVWLWANGHISVQAITMFAEVLYAPLGWICENIPWADDFVEWYINLWIL